MLQWLWHLLTMASSTRKKPPYCDSPLYRWQGCKNILRRERFNKFHPWMTTSFAIRQIMNMTINSPTAVHLPWDSITFVKSLLRYRRTLSVSYSCLSYLTSYWILEFSEFVSFAVCSLFFMFIIHNRFRIIDAFIARNESTYIGTKSAYSANLWSKVCRVSEVLRSGVHVPSNRRYAEKWHYNQGYWNNQGWGGPAVQYRQSTPVLWNLGPVTDWMSTFYGPGLDRERQSYDWAKGPVLAHTGACCIKCYVWKRSQYCYEFYVSVPWKRNILQKLGYECNRNILYNRPLYI